MTTSDCNITISIHELEAAVKASGRSKRKQAISLITACIEGKIDTISSILDAATSLGLSRSHIALILQEGYNRRWRLADGVYTLIR